MRRGKLRVIGRWGVCVAALFFCMALILSIFPRPRLYFIYTQSDAQYSATIRSVHFTRGAFVLYTQPPFHSIPLDYPETRPQPKPGWRFIFRFKNDLVYAPQISQSYQSWFVPLYLNHLPSNQVWTLPLIYPATLFLLWSMRIGLKHKKQLRILEDRCVGCGYSLVGLDGGVCPQCGEKGEG